MSNEITVPQYEDGFDVSEPTTGSLVKGKMVKFRDDAWLINGEEHMPEDHVQFSVLSMLTLWTKWEGEKKQPIHVITRSGQAHPAREDMGDLDEALWPKGLDGGKSDPWQDSRNVTLLHADSAQVYTYLTASVGGRIAVSELKNAIMLRRRARPGCYPIVELTTAQMKTRFGDRLRPAFRIVGWHEGEASAPPAPPPKYLTPAEVMETLRKAAPAPTSGELLQDDIPFAPEFR
jgi:hypothetical protein